MDLIILGPSSTGKTKLANFLASKFGLPIFNCDSVQVFKHLNALSNKPTFIRQEKVDGEIISYSYRSDELYCEDYGNLDFTTFRYVEDSFKSAEFDEVKKLLEDLDNDFTGMFLNERFIMGETCLVQNFLFDIREPGEIYSTVDFEKDITRISAKFGFKDKIIVGGTVYYAYNYLLSLNRSIDADVHLQRDRLKNLSNKDLIRIIGQNDPKSLQFLDLCNRRRLENAASAVLSGRRYSEEYFKTPRIRGNFCLVMFFPKDRSKYYKLLDRGVESRLSERAFDEISFLISHYGEGIVQWLRQISYEYKCFLELYFSTVGFPMEEKELHTLRDNEEVSEILQILKYKEHQYSKRQITFLRKLKKTLQGIFTSSIS